MLQGDGALAEARDGRVTEEVTVEKVTNILDQMIAGSKESLLLHKKAMDKKLLTTRESVALYQESQENYMRHAQSEAVRIAINNTEDAVEDKMDSLKAQVKEMKFRPGTDEGDYQVKLRNLTRFLSDGDKAKVTLRFRGREMAHQELGIELLKRIEADLAELGTVEQFPKMEGRQLIMVLAPNTKKKGGSQAAKDEPEAVAEAEV